MSAQRSASGGSARLGHRGGQLASPRLDFLVREAGASLWTLPSPGHCQGMTTSRKGVSSGDAWPFANHALPQLGVMLSADSGQRRPRAPDYAAAGTGGRWLPGVPASCRSLVHTQHQRVPKVVSVIVPVYRCRPRDPERPRAAPWATWEAARQATARPPLFAGEEPSDPAPEPSPGCGRHPAVQGCGRHPRIRGRGLETPAAPYPNCWPPSREGAGRRRPRAPWAARPRSKCERL